MKEGRNEKNRFNFTNGFSFILCFFTIRQIVTFTVAGLSKLNTLSNTDTACCGYKVKSEAKKGSFSSIDVNYKIAEHYGFHFAYISNAGKHNEWVYWSSYVYGPYKYKNPISIWELGPEWNFRLSDKFELYLQLNFGRTSGSTNDYYWNDCGLYYRTYKMRMNEWTLGSAIGIRYFIGNRIGLVLQTGYHYIFNWWYSPLWDVRGGVVFKF